MYSHYTGPDFPSRIFIDLLFCDEFLLYFILLILLEDKVFDVLVVDTFTLLSFWIPSGYPET